MSSNKRIYLVQHRVGDVTEQRLVEAPNAPQSIAHVVRSRVTARVASQSDLVRLVGAGVKVECSGDQ